MPITTTQFTEEIAQSLRAAYLEGHRSIRIRSGDIHRRMGGVSRPQSENASLLQRDAEPYDPTGPNYCSAT